MFPHFRRSHLLFYNNTAGERMLPCHKKCFLCLRKLYCRTYLLFYNNTAGERMLPCHKKCFLCLRKLYCRTFSSLGSCTGLTYSLLTLSYVHLIYLFNYFIVYFILSMFLYSCATHFLNPFILGTHLISSLRYCVSCIIAYKLS